MSSIQAVGARIIKQTLLAEPDIVSIFAGKVFWGNAEESTSFPYITISHISGGEDNDAQSRAVDYNWKVVGHTAKSSSRVPIANAISKALVRKMPVTTDVDNVEGYTWIEELTAIADEDIEQNTYFYQIGGIFRLRLTLGVSF